MSLHKDQVGGIIHLQPRWVADLAACLPSSLQLGCEGLDWRPALELPGVQQPLPEVHTSRARHRCSAPAWRSNERHINADRMVLRLLAWFWSRSSGQVRRSPHLMETDGFPGACHRQIISSDGKSVWFGWDSLSDVSAEQHVKSGHFLFLLPQRGRINISQQRPF